MLSLLNNTNLKSPIGKKKFSLIKNEILGKKYQLSVVLTDKKESKKLNKKYRSKNKSANVLSFPIENDLGEIFLNLETKAEAPKFQMNYKKYLTFLFIHGCLHLKGLDHGPKMEKLEEQFLKRLY